MSDRVVIVGAGQGGLQVAASLRQDGFTGAITLIGDEPGLPYQRPPLSKAYMKDGDESRLALKPASFFGAAEVDYRPATIVAGIDRAAAEVVLDEARGRHRVTWAWIKGHAGHPENERADELARAGMAPFK